MSNGLLQYEYFSSVTQHKVEWLWYPYIPYGKLTILQGDPGEGKSTFMLNVAALLTRGKNMPDGYQVKEPQKVVYQTAEDNLADTVKPRLIAAGADCNRIAYIVDEEEPLTLMDSRIESVIQQTKARLFIYDAYLSGWSQAEIAAFLTDIGCETKTGSKDWNSGSIGYILTNERYCGNVLTWKTFTADLFEHKHKRNCKDRDQYLYMGRHDAIVSLGKFELVQTLLENRKHHLHGSLPLLHVIDEGIFRGFIPVNHHWINNDPKVYYDIANSIDQHVRIRKIDKRELSAFNLEGYQVVRNQFTQVRYEGPSITISDDRITFNIFCMKKFSDVGYIQLLLHPTERKIAIRPCREKDTHSIRWRMDPEKPFYSKSLSCPHFGSALYCIMGWNPDYLYKIRGIWAKRLSEQIIVFNLSNGVPAVIVTNDGNITGAKRRVEMCPDEWTDDFGDEFYEHVLENGFYYLTPDADWQTAAPSIPAPGLEQYMVPTQKDVQLRIETIMRRDDNGNV